MPWGYGLLFSGGRVGQDGVRLVLFPWQVVNGITGPGSPRSAHHCRVPKLTVWLIVEYQLILNSW